MAKKHWKPRLGRWKEKPNRRKTFIRRALKSTESSMRKIGRRAVKSDMTPISARVVSYHNRRGQIRDTQTIDRIAAKSHKTSGPKRMVKVSLFTPGQKLKILKLRERQIWKEVIYFWRNPNIKNKFKTKTELKTELENFIFDWLDFFDPKKRTKEGKPPRVSSAITRGSNIFYKRQFPRVKRKAGTIQVTEERKLSNGASTAVKGIVDSREVKFLVEGIPPATKRFLTKLGLNIENVAVAGIDNVRDKLNAVVITPETGLDEREKQVVKLRLEGTKARDIQKLVKTMDGGRNISNRTVLVIENTAIKKMKAQLQREKSKQLI